jgi:phosphate:Na+ symporter
MENPLLGIVAGAVFTGLVQSSAATVGIAIAMASEGLLTLPAGIALALGANIGTCVTALLAALGKPTEAVRAAVVHVTFNIVGVLIWLPFLSMLADAAIAVSPTTVGLEGKAQLAADVPRQIANANTLFNVINTLLFIGFTTWFARLAQKLVPDRAEPEGVIIEPEFLIEEALEVPSIALDNARREIHRTGGIALDMMDSIGQALERHAPEQLDEVARRDDSVDILGLIRQGSLTQEEGATHQALMTSITDLENLADVMETDMVPLSKRYLDGEFEASSAETHEMVVGMWEGVRRALELTVQAVGENDQRAAQDVLLLKDKIRDLADAFFQRHALRLRADDPKYLKRVQMMMEFIEQLRHMYTLSKRIAKTQLPDELAREAG